MGDERGADPGDNEQSQETSDAEVTNGDADETKDMVAHDTQMRYSPSFSLESPHVCVGMDVNRPKEKGQQVMEGTQPRLARRTALKRHVKLQNLCSRALGHTPSRPRAKRKVRGDQTGRGEKVVVREYLSDVCGEDANDEQPRNQCGLLASVMESRLSPSPMLNRIQCSRHVQGVLRCVGELERNAGSRRCRTGG